MKNAVMGTVSELARVRVSNVPPSAMAISLKLPENESLPPIEEHDAYAVCATASKEKKRWRCRILNFGLLWAINFVQVPSCSYTALMLRKDASKAAIGPRFPIIKTTSGESRNPSLNVQASGLSELLPGPL